MRRSSLVLSILLAMLLLVAWVAWAMILLPHKSYVAWGGGVLLSILIALLFRAQLHADIATLDWLVQRLPKTGQATARPLPREFESTVEALQQASERLERSFSSVGEERRELEALLDSMQDAVVAVDAAGRIQWSNQAMQRLMPGGTSTSAVRVGHALVHTVRDPEVLACVRMALEERKVCERRTTTLMPGLIFEVNASPMPAGGAVAVLHDITRIEEVERTQRDFVANVSHELRTPLTSISGYVETLLDHEESLSQVGREFLGTILKNASRMSRLTEDLLTMARVESRESVLHPKVVRADALVRDAVAAMRGMLQDAEAEADDRRDDPGGGMRGHRLDGAGVGQFN